MSKAKQQVFIRNFPALRSVTLSQLSRDINIWVLAWMLPEYEHCKDRKEIKYYESVEQVSFQQKLPSS